MHQLLRQCCTSASTRGETSGGALSQVCKLQPVGLDFCNVVVLHRSSIRAPAAHAHWSRFCGSCMVHSAWTRRACHPAFASPCCDSAAIEPHAVSMACTICRLIRAASFLCVHLDMSRLRCCGLVRLPVRMCVSCRHGQVLVRSLLPVILSCKTCLSSCVLRSDAMCNHCMAYVSLLYCDRARNGNYANSRKRSMNEMNLSSPTHQPN